MVEGCCGIPARRKITAAKIEIGSAVVKKLVPTPSYQLRRTHYSMVAPNVLCTTDSAVSALSPLEYLPLFIAESASSLATMLKPQFSAISFSQVALSSVICATALENSGREAYYGR